MDSILTIVQRKRAEGVTDPKELGYAVAKAVPRKWKISVYICLKASIPKADHKAIFEAFFEEQRRKPLKFKKRNGKITEEIEEDDEPEQLDLLG